MKLRIKILTFILLAFLFSIMFCYNKLFAISDYEEVRNYNTNFSNDLTYEDRFVYWKVGSRDYNYSYPYEYGLYEYLSKNNIDVSRITEIIFNNVKETGKTINSSVSLDVSKKLDKSVMIYIEENKLYIQYEGTLILDNAIGLFMGFKNVTYIRGLEYIDTSEVSSMWCMFNGCESLLEIDVSSFNTSNVTNMQSMFANCLKIKKIDLSNFNTERVQSMGFMFENNKWLEELNLKGFNTKTVNNMRSMFYNCIWLRRVDLTSFDTRNVTSMDRMFYKSGLEELDLSSFDTSKVTDMSDMFWYASSLTKIYVSKMWNVEGVRDSSSMFGGNTKLSGNNGTKYDSSIERDKTYARIDSYYTTGYLSVKIDIQSDTYNLENDYIFVGNQQFDVSKIKTTNCTKTIENNTLYINYEDILIRKYDIINVWSEYYDIEEECIVVFEETTNLSKINVINASKEMLKDVLYIKVQDEVVKEYKINKPYEEFVLDNTVIYDGQVYGIKLREVNPYNIRVKYADKNGNYILTEMPKYSDVGTYKINYMLYVDNKHGFVKGYKTLTIKKADIKYQANNKTVTYNGNKFGIDLNVYNPKNASIRYADKNGNYTLTEMPQYSEVGIYTIKYRIFVGDNHTDVFGEQTLEILDIELPFIDVPKNIWYYNAVRYTYVQGMIKGMTESTFDPNGDLTRGMLVTILWRMEGSPKVEKNHFTDVAENTWYSNAVNWAASNKIVNGYGNEKFGPNDKITREQLAIMLRNYAIYKKKDVSARVDLSNFVDSTKISEYAMDAVSWAVANKIISGKSEGTRVDPHGKATRAEVATMLYNYCLNIG